QTAKLAVDFVLGMLAHAASVEKDYIGVFRLVRQFKTLAAQAADHQLAVEHVHLAAYRFDVELFRHDFISCSGLATGPILLSMHGSFLERHGAAPPRGVLLGPPPP